jgi:hypothetical protein
MKKIKVGLLIDKYDLPLWEHIMISRIISSKYASIELIILRKEKEVKNSYIHKIKNNWKYAIYILYRKLDKKLFKVQPDAFKKKNILPLIKGIKIIEVKPISTKFSDRFNKKDILKIKDCNLDVLIRLGFKILKGEILSVAKYGVWSYHHGDNDVNRGGPAGLWEVLHNENVTGSTLQILSEELDAGKIIYKSFSQTRNSIYRNNNNSYWKSLSFLPRKLEELHNIGGVKFLNKVDIENTRLKFYSNRFFSPKNLTNITALKLIALHLSKIIKNKIINIFYIEQWILLFRIDNNISKSFWKFAKITPEKDRFFADPFVVEKNSKFYIFIEEFIYMDNKGHISVIEMDKDGKYSKPVKILNKHYHLSYPFVFNDKGEYFLIPESRSNKTIEVYKSTNFPFKWDFHMNLMQNIEAVDTTLFFYQNKYWLFTNIVENPGSSSVDELFLFHSPVFPTNNWISHPLNPIISDARNARPAGNIFIHNNRIIRPSQNNEKMYGFGLKMNEILILNENEYKEIEIDSIKPNWDKKIIATHTFNNVGGLTIIDGIQRKSIFTR